MHYAKVANYHVVSSETEQRPAKTGMQILTVILI